MSIILNDEKEWPCFIQLVRAQCLDLGIWEKCNPDLDNPALPLAKPERVTTVMAGAAPGTPITGLSAAEVATYRLLQVVYEISLDEYFRERTSLATTHQWVREHITKRNLYIIAPSKSLYETLKRLKARYHRTDEEIRLDLQIEWRQLMNSEFKFRDQMEVLDKVINLHQNMVEESIRKESDRMALIECLNLIGRMDRSRGIFTNHYVALCAAFSALGGFLFGYDQGVVSVILVMDRFLIRFPRVAETASGAGFWKGLLTAVIELGALIGALNQGWVADKISRKYSIVVAVGIFIVGSALQTAAVDYAMLVIARLIGGVGIGMLSMVVPLYISEISPPEMRGSLLVLEEFSIVSGIVIAFWITYGTQYIPSEWSWRLPCLLQIIPGFILGIGIIFLPFSPRWLSSKGRDQEALGALARLRGLPTDDKRVRQEWFDIRAEVTFQQEVSRERHPQLQDGSRKSRAKLEVASWTDCFKKGCWRRTHVGMGLMFFQQFVGINALIYYSPTLFQTMGQGHSMQLILSGVLNIAQLVGVSTSLWTMDRFGRRPLLLWGSVVMCFSHVIIAALVGQFSSNWPAHRGPGWTSVAFLFVYMVAFGASWGPVPWAMPAEIFPSSLRAKGVGLSTASNWLNNFIIGLITPPLVQNTGFGAYIFFAVFCGASFAWTYFFVPETNGRGLEEMDHVFQDYRGEDEMARRVRIERAILEGDSGEVGGEGVKV
ncbi:putative MFS monosaccharide transporter [Venturia nashicola]|uniref:Putative MFS monosaccharide transporter n=1 Tax=Venturia nashicola TaxID=86259 RepID=A0A4Z1P332_9PEZI|nr:putative MFS monosaccharide transporter [Venturia nashicola]TLD20024.1 putative MFS monosaccharide transporter [Venturia nashicola]